MPRTKPPVPETPETPPEVQRAVAPVAQSAQPFLPEDRDLQSLRDASQDCQGCELYAPATQTVFGHGPPGARVLMIGEQPGDEEDKQGLPFVGPAGRLLRQALEQAGVPVASVYLTNAVKHFYFQMSGKRRLHKKPAVRHVVACRPWLVAEVEALAPQVVVCLGTTAARAVFGRDVTLTRLRGAWQQSPWSERTLVTVHPSAILRVPEREARHAALAAFVADLRLIAQELDQADDQ